MPVVHDANLESRCHAVSVLLEKGAFFSHSTSALLWGVPLPAAFERDLALHASVVSPVNAPEIRGVTAHVHRSLPHVVRGPSGLRMASPACTWTMLAQSLSTADLVAAGDFMVSGKWPLTTLRELESAVRDREGRRGVKRMREALPQVRAGVRSRRETHARLLAIAAGFPEPELNVELFDERGLFVAMVDMAWRGHRVGLEYEGKHHQETQQFRRDVSRRERVEDIGWRLMRATANDLSTGVEEFVKRLGLRLHHPLSTAGIARAIALSRTFG